MPGQLTHGEPIAVGGEHRERLALQLNSDAGHHRQRLIAAGGDGNLGDRGRERIGLYTTFLADGSLFYYLTIVPENDAPAFEETFRRVGESIR